MINNDHVKNIILIGMPGCGKTTLGRLLADRLEFQFIDTDQLITDKVGKSPRQIVEENGLDYFMEVQSRVILSINQTNCIIATGGGVIHSEVVMQHLKYMGLIIYLHTKYDIIEERMDKSRRLVRNGDSLIDLYNIRVPLYKKYADFILNCDSTEPQILCDKMLREIAYDHKL